MIISPKLLLIYPLIVFDINSSNHTETYKYIPYTTTNMIQQDDKVINEFWNNLIKEGCEKENQWNQHQ